MPWQQIYWYARHVKADCLIKLNEFEAASIELTLFSKRRFTPDNKNYPWRKKVFSKLGKCLIETGQYKEAVLAFTAAIEIKEGKGNVSEADLLVQRGIAKKKGNMKGFRIDWKAATELGSKTAAKLLSGK